MIDAARKVYVVAHKEDTSKLEATLASEGFSVQVNRLSYTAQETKYSAAYRCLLNHMDVWARVQSDGEPAIVVEADFVPVRGMARLPSPVPACRLHHSIAWLYYGGGRLRGMDDEGYALGTAPTMVAILCSPAGAGCMLRFGRQECVAEKVGKYSTWDVQLAVDVRAHGITVYLPFKSYGEHGGLGNTEHEKHGVRTHHRADVLWGRLAFLPAYAHGRLVTYWGTRLFYRCRGTLKLFAGRYIPFREMVGRPEYPAQLLARMTAFALRRFFA